jgi:hypothetical protein
MGNLTWIDALLSPLLLAWSSLSGRGSWGGRAWADFAGAFLVLLLVLAMLRRSLHPLFAGRRKLLWIWLGAVCLGPVAFDLMRHTLTAQISRYALAGLPAAVLLLSLAAARLPRKGRVLFLSLLVLTWVPNLWAIVATTVRNNEPYRPLARRLAMWTGPEDVVVVHAIPSGLIALARYSDTTAPFAAWVQQLGLRTVPKDLLELSAGRRRVAVVRVHEVATPAPEEAWLLEHARILTQREWPTRDRWNRNRLLVVEAPRQTGAPTPPPSRDQAPAAAAGREPADRGSESWR